MAINIPDCDHTQGPYCTVDYEGHRIDLTAAQYDELRRLAFDDPVAADAMALDLLKRQVAR